MMTQRIAVILIILFFVLIGCTDNGEDSLSPGKTETYDGSDADTAGSNDVTQPSPPPLTEQVLSQPAGADNPNPPVQPVKLVFIHHSVGENWLADDDGGLGLALQENNYFVSDSNYGWGPDNIGDRTDISDWSEWFRGPNSERYTRALYNNFENVTGNYSRMNDPDPGRKNEIILFKSCYPNSNLDGSLDDPPAPDYPSTVSGARYVYIDLLEYFATQPDKLFVVVTAPPVTADDSWAPQENTRAFNNWLVDDWLSDYLLPNVAVLDFYNVLTSNGGHPLNGDANAEQGNHHRWWNGEVQHVQTIDNDLAAYPTDDSHPNAVGNQKATSELVPLINVFFNRWRGEVTSSVTPPTAVQPVPEAIKQEISPTTSPSDLIWPDNLAYIGAFRLPDGPEYGWYWGGSALAYYPEGDSGGVEDGFPGSLFGTGHNHYQYVSEINIPEPIVSQAKDLDSLNTAETLQPFQDIRGDLFDHRNFEIPQVGLAILPAQGNQTRDKLYFCWGQHFHEEGADASHGWCELNLSDPRPAGPWHINNISNYSTNDYLFPIPESWAEDNTPGRLLATGRFRDGGWSGGGPSLYAIGPWLQGNPPQPESVLETVPLLQYANNMESGVLDRSLAMDNYHHADEWSAGAWLTDGNKSAVVFAGTKGEGDCWYGFASGVVWPDEPPFPEVPAPPYDDRGWWSSEFQGQIIFYDPAELSAVAHGVLASAEPQPYATLNVDPFLFGVYSSQQKYHLGAASFDRERGIFYIFEPLADGDKPLVHVWRIIA